MVEASARLSELPSNILLSRRRERERERERTKKIGLSQQIHFQTLSTINRTKSIELYCGSPKKKKRKRKFGEIVK